MADRSDVFRFTMVTIVAALAAPSVLGATEFTFLSQSRTLQAYAMAESDGGVVVEDSDSDSVDHLESWYRLLDPEAAVNCVNVGMDAEMDTVLDNDRLLLDVRAAGGAYFCEGTSGDTAFSGEARAFVEFEIDEPTYVRVRWFLWNYVGDAAVWMIGPDGVVVNELTFTFEEERGGGFNQWLEPGIYTAQAKGETDDGGEGDYDIWSYGTAELDVLVTVPGDVDGDRDVDLSDLLDVLSAWGPCPSNGACFEDVDANGTVDFIDLLTLLGNFGD